MITHHGEKKNQMGRISKRGIAVQSYDHLLHLGIQMAQA